MVVSDLMTREVISCRAGDSLERAAQIMWERDCGCVPVVDEQQKLRGMITDRDLVMAAYTTGQPLAKLRVEQAMARTVHSCRTNDELDAALHSMSEAQVRRLPVVDGGEKLVGVLSLTDLVQAVGEPESRLRRRWLDGLVVTLVEVTRPREVVEKPRAALPATDGEAPRGQPASREPASRGTRPAERPDRG